MPRKPAKRAPGRAYLAEPRSESGAGVLVLHAWWGLTDFVKSVCDRLADLGYVALAPDLYDGATASTIEEAERLRNTLKEPVAQKNILTALDDLRNRLHSSPRTKTAARSKSKVPEQDRPLGLLGFSLGAYYAVWLACERPSEFGGVVLYYGTGDADFGKARASFLCHFAETDPYEQDEWVRQFEERLRSAGRDVTVHVYPKTGHWFFEEDRPGAYDPKAAQLSWTRTTDFLRRRLLDLQ